MKRFEYKCFNIVVDFKFIYKSNKTEACQKVQAELNKLGAEGWELVSVNGTWFYLKRQID